MFGLGVFLAFLGVIYVIRETLLAANHAPPSTGGGGGGSDSPPPDPQHMS